MVPNFHFAIEMKIRKHLYDELEKLAIFLVWKSLQLMHINQFL